MQAVCGSISKHSTISANIYPFIHTPTALQGNSQVGIELATFRLQGNPLHLLSHRVEAGTLPAQFRGLFLSGSDSRQRRWSNCLSMVSACGVMLGRPGLGGGCYWPGVLLIVLSPGLHRPGQRCSGMRPRSPAECCNGACEGPTWSPHVSGIRPTGFREWVEKMRAIVLGRLN